jgi:hypothetical protein
VQNPYTKNFVTNTSTSSNDSIYWVHRKDGNDSTGDGSQDSPYLTIQAAMTAAISATANVWIGILDDAPILNQTAFCDASTGLKNNVFNNLGIVRMKPNLVAETRTIAGGSPNGNIMLDEYDGLTTHYTFDLCKIKVAGHTIYLRRSIVTPFTSSTTGSYIEWSPTGSNNHGVSWVRLLTSGETTAYYGTTASGVANPIRYAMPALPSHFSYLTDATVDTARRGSLTRLTQVGNDVYIFCAANGTETHTYKISANPNYEPDDVCHVLGSSANTQILQIERVYNLASPLNDIFPEQNKWTNTSVGLAAGNNLKPAQVCPGQIDGKNSILWNGTLYFFTSTYTSANELDSPSLGVVRSDDQSIMGLEKVNYPSGYQNPKTAALYYTTNYEDWISTGTIESIFGDETATKVWDFEYIGDHYYLLATNTINKTIQVARYTPSTNTWTKVDASNINSGLAMNIVTANLLSVNGHPVIQFAGNVNASLGGTATYLLSMKPEELAFDVLDKLQVYNRQNGSVSYGEYYKGRFHITGYEYSCSFGVTDYNGGDLKLVNAYSVWDNIDSYSCVKYHSDFFGGNSNIFEHSVNLVGGSSASYFKSYNVNKSNSVSASNDFGFRSIPQGKNFFVLWGLYTGNSASLGPNQWAEKAKIQHDAATGTTANKDLIINNSIIEELILANPAESNKGYIDTINIKESFIKSTSNDGLVIESDGTTNDVVIQFTTIEARKIKFDYGTSGALLNAYLENNIWKVDDITYTPTSGNDVVIDYALFTGGISGAAPYISFGNNTIYRDPLFRNAYGELQRKIYGDYVESPAIRASSELNLVTGSKRDLGAYNIDDSLVIETYRTSVYLPKPPGNSIEMREIPTTSTHIAISGSPDVTNDPNKKTEYLTITYENVTDDVYQVFREIEASLFDMTVYLALDPNYLTDTPSITTSQAASIGDVEIYIVPTAIYAGSRLNIGGVDYYIRYKVNNNNNLTTRVVLDMPLKTAISNATVIELTHPVGNGEYEYIPQERRFKRADSADMDVKGSFQVVFARKSL